MSGAEVSGVRVWTDQPYLEDARMVCMHGTVMGMIGCVEQSFERAHVEGMRNYVCMGWVRILYA